MGRLEVELARFGPSAIDEEGKPPSVLSVRIDIRDEERLRDHVVRTEYFGGDTTGLEVDAGEGVEPEAVSIFAPHEVADPVLQRAPPRVNGGELERKGRGDAHRTPRERGTAAELDLPPLDGAVDLGGGGRTAFDVREERRPGVLQDVRDQPPLVFVGIEDMKDIKGFGLNPSNLSRPLFARKDSHQGWLVSMPEIGGPFLSGVAVRDQG